MQRGLSLLIPLTGALVLVSYACASPMDLGAADFDGSASNDIPDASPPIFIPADGGEADVTAAGACIASECPYPYATCIDELGSVPVYRCMTNLSNDTANCGACGVLCGGGSDLGVTWQCSSRQCQVQCSGPRLDCNGIVDDGCEVNRLSDPANCGACGVVCPTGAACMKGKCGCAPGEVECHGTCKDVRIDDLNCGTCGFSCYDHPPDDAGALASNMFYGCAQGTCRAPKCRRDDGFWKDCNGDPLDGCEINLTGYDENYYNDANNCGACGNKCAPGQLCFDNADGQGISCQCKDGKTNCGYACLNLDTDRNNCGSCGYVCLDPGRVDINRPNGEVACRLGRCDYRCLTGFADCNERLDDGCEADLQHDPRNCGGCGVGCAPRQPCVDGQCATVACDGGTVTK